MSEKESSDVGPKYLWKLDVTCPNCGKTMYIDEYMHRIPVVGRVILSGGECKECGYGYRDVRMAESRGSQILRFRVQRPEDLNTLVVRASSASIYIPELKVSITPGAASQGFITTIEGVLHRVVEVMKFLRNDPDVDLDAWSERMRMIEKALNGELKFTFVLEDPEGVSRIVSDEEEREEMYNG